MGSHQAPNTHVRRRLVSARKAGALRLRLFLRETCKPCLVGTAQHLVLSGLDDTIGPLVPRIAQSFPPTPRFDLRMMAAEQHIGHTHAVVFLGPRVVRTIEQHIDKTVLYRRL